MTRKQYTTGKEVDIRYRTDENQRSRIREAAVRNDREMGHEIYHRVNRSFSIDARLDHIDSTLTHVVELLENGQ